MQYSILTFFCFKHNVTSFAELQASKVKYVLFNTISTSINEWMPTATYGLHDGLEKFWWPENGKRAMSIIAPCMCACMNYLLQIVCAVYLLYGEPSFLERIGLSENLLESLFSFLLALLPRPTEHVGEHFVAWSVNRESFSVYDMKECFNGEEV